MPEEIKKLQPQQGTKSFATFLAKVRKFETEKGAIRSTAHTSSVAVPEDMDVNSGK